jgi:hypothetical protein
MDCLGTRGTIIRPSCRSTSSLQPSPTPTDHAIVRDLVFGPKVVAELAILRRLARA